MSRRSFCKRVACVICGMVTAGLTSSSSFIAS
ncbi:MAG: twin-arginine translocation signal domain-containing protein [Oscillospiraceae bacterium]